MYVSLGFFIAGLLAIAVIPAVWRRAVRLTRKAVEATTPMTLSDTRAEISAIRAAHAIDYRRLEKVAERLRAELTENRIARDQAEAHARSAAKDQQASQGSQRETLARNDELNRRITELEGQTASYAAKVRELEGELEARTQAYSALLGKQDQAPAAAIAGPLPPQEDIPGGEATLDADLPAELAATASAALLAEITSLESENASLRDKLKKAEESLAAAHAERRAAPAAASSDKAMREQQKSLDNKLFDMEARYIAAQAEITRLTLQLERYEFDADEAGSPSAEANDRIAGLEATIEKLRLALDAKERAADFPHLRERLKDVAAELTAGLADEADLGALTETVPAAANEDGKTLADRIRTVRGRLAADPDSAIASSGKR